MKYKATYCRQTNFIILSQDDDQLFGLRADARGPPPFPMWLMRGGPPLADARGPPLADARGPPPWLLLGDPPFCKYCVDPTQILRNVA